MVESLSWSAGVGFSVDVFRQHRWWLFTVGYKLNNASILRAGVGEEGKKKKFALAQLY